MRRRRALPALIGTIALIAGCGSSTRVEVSGVVRDRATGRAIAGARVVAADGSATTTDARGRFTLSVARDRVGSVRASADAHADVTELVDASAANARELALDLELARVRDETEARAAGEPDPDAVLRFLEEGWVDDALRWARTVETRTPELARAHDDAEEVLRVRAAIALLGATVPEHGEVTHAHASLECDACHAELGPDARALRAGMEADLDGATCAPCHGAARPAAIGGVHDLDGDGTVGLLAAELDRARTRARAAVDEAVHRAAIERCGCRATGVARATAADGASVLALVDARGAPLGDCDESGAIDGAEHVVTIDVLPAPLAAAARDLGWLEDDASDGAHVGRLAIDLAIAVEARAHASRALH